MKDFFEPYVRHLPDDSWLFVYGRAIECLTRLSYIIPSTDEIWLAAGQISDMVTDLYVSYSAADLICFANLGALAFPRLAEQRAYAALGLLPAQGQIQVLKEHFPHARWHTLFGDPLLGSIADVSIAAWLKGHDARFNFMSGLLIVVYRGKTFEFDHAGFSLAFFERHTGLRAGVRTHKPPAGFASFLNYHLSQNHDP